VVEPTQQPDAIKWGGADWCGGDDVANDGVTRNMQGGKNEQLSVHLNYTTRHRVACP